MTGAYWLVGRHIVEFEQAGVERASYGIELIERLSDDLSRRFGRGFSRQNLQQMRLFYMAYRPERIRQTPSGELPEGRRAKHDSADTVGTNGNVALRATALQGSSGPLTVPDFRLPWSAYVRLLSVKDAHARDFYEAEALRGGWSVRQLNRQINSQFYERTALSRDKAALLRQGQTARPEDVTRPEAEIKDPFVSRIPGPQGRVLRA